MKALATIAIIVGILLALSIGFANIPTEWKADFMKSVGFVDKLISSRDEILDGGLDTTIEYENPWDLSEKEIAKFTKEINDLYSKSLGERLLYVDEYHSTEDCPVILEICSDYPDLDGCRFCKDEIHTYQFYRISEQYRYDVGDAQ